MTKLHHIWKISLSDIFPTEHFALKLQVFLWFPEFLKVEWEAEPSVIKPLSCGPSYHYISAGGPPMSHLSSLCSLFSRFYFLIWYYLYLVLLLSLTFVSLSQQVPFEWCLLSHLFCPLKPQLVEADGHPFDSARGFFVLKGSRFSPQSLSACSGQETGPKRSFGAICLFP